MAGGLTHETEKTTRTESVFFAEHTANPLHALLDGTLNGTNPQTQPKARERIPRGRDLTEPNPHCHYDTKAGKSPQPFDYKTANEWIAHGSSSRFAIIQGEQVNLTGS